jgi:isopentenyl-diphosphate Delta-isomerase
MSEEQVILVDHNDQEIGTMGKMQAHREGVLHRAISVFIFNSEGKWLLQKRAPTKYHSGGLWTNACCSHPRAGEETSEAAKRRLLEEMGLQCDLKFLFSFRYKEDVGSGLTEHELDHVFIGKTNATPKVNSSEASDWSFYTTDELGIHLKETPERFTKWFQLIYQRVKETQK